MAALLDGSTITYPRMEISTGQPSKCACTEEEQYAISKRMCGYMGKWVKMIDSGMPLAMPKKPLLYMLDSDSLRTRGPSHSRGHLDSRAYWTS